MFDELFTRSIAQCSAAGLIDGRGSALGCDNVRAHLDRERVGTPDSPDPDAPYGKFPGKRTAPGYKQQEVVDAASHGGVGGLGGCQRIVRNTMGRLTRWIGRWTVSVRHRRPCVPTPAYASGHNKAALEARGVRLVRSSHQESRPTWIGHQSRHQDLSYDETRDEFTCPARMPLGDVLRCQGSSPPASVSGVTHSVSRRCPLKPRCTIAPQRTLKVSADHAALLRLQADSRTAAFPGTVSGTSSCG